uniref:Aminopeptidase N n=1 Tax=Ascaris lumbricoides TaxID=6252 RepID=A0A0M3ILF3_ASCLU
MGEYFITSAVDAALQRDARASSHPLYFPIEKAEDVSEVFDDITYDKGAAIIHMIEDVMGSDNFKKGLNIYLNRYKYSNAANNDLWSALNEAVPDTLLAWNGEKLDIRDFASKWTEQMGYPMVEIRRLNSTRIELHQKRFKWDDDALEREKFRNAKFWYKYDIPIWYEINGEEKPMEWLHEAQGMNLKADELLVLNSGARGFYRVNYNKECWQKIVNQLLDDHTKIGVRSRARIIDDAFALAQAGHLSYEIPLNISAYLPKEEEYLPWSMALDGFAVILSNFDDEPEVEHVRINKPFCSELEYDIIRQYCAIRKIDCTERLMDLFKSSLLDVCQGDEVLSSECSKVPVPVRAMVYCEGVRQSAEKVWNKMFELYQRERVQVERERLLIGLTCSRDTFTLKKLLDLASNLNDTSIRLQDAPTVFRSISIRDVGSKIIFDYFQDNWIRLYREYDFTYSVI